MLKNSQFQKSLDRAEKIVSKWSQAELKPNFGKLTSTIKVQVFKRLFKTACTSKNHETLSLSRWLITTLPREWTCQQIIIHYKDLIDITNEYEYRKLLELTKPLDKDLFNSFLQLGLKIGNTAKEFQ